MGFFEYLQRDSQNVWNAVLVHIDISLLSALFAILIAIPVGILLTRNDKVAKIVLAIAGVIQTIPGLVMLGIGLLLFGLGLVPSVIVLVAYSILPIMENTYTGIREVDGMYTEAAKGIGMSSFQIMTKIELPLALPAIVAGIRMSVVYIISWATLAALIGAGGLGDLIWAGLSTYDTNMILAGAIPSSLLAIIAGIIIDLIQKAVTPRGMRIKKEAQL